MEKKCVFKTVEPKQMEVLKATSQQNPTQNGLKNIVYT